MTVAISSQPKRTAQASKGTPDDVSSKPQPKPLEKEESLFFQAVGIVSGVVELDKEQPTIAINRKEFPLLCFPPHTQVIKFLKKEIEATNSQYQKLIVYPRVVHFPQSNVRQQVKFCLMGYVGSGSHKGNQITDRLKNNEFQFKGLWQFIPPCKVPCITVYRNSTPELKRQLKEMSEVARHKTLKANHIPVLWRESSVKPFRYNRHLSKSEQGDLFFVQIKARFLPERDVFGFIEEEAAPYDRVPRSLRQKKTLEK